MTPSIPTLIPDSSALGNAAAPQSAIASLLDVFAAANPASIAVTPGQAAPDFAQLLAAPAASGQPAILPLQGENPAVPATPGEVAAPTVAAPQSVPVVPQMPVPFAFRNALECAAQNVLPRPANGAKSVAPAGADATAEVSAVDAEQTAASTESALPKREVIEAIAALLAPLWQALPPAPVATSSEPTTPSEPAAEEADVEVTVQLEGVAPMKFTFTAPTPVVLSDEEDGSPATVAADEATQNPLSAGAPAPVTSDSSFAPKLVEAEKQTTATVSHPTPAEVPTASSATSEGSPEVAETSWAATTPSVFKVEVKGGEKFAGKIRLNFADENAGRNASEKNFLFAKEEQVKPEASAAGTGVAESDDDMPALNTVRRFADASEESTTLFNVRETPAWASPAVPEVKLISVRAENGSSSNATADAAPLAHRAVETILNVADAQQSRALHTGVVNLHFKFGAEDLAVRVQLRDGEVHTQFHTDSAELRSALADEWNAVAGQGNSGLRLIEPVFAASNSGNSTEGSSLSSQNQFASHHQNAQSQGQSSSFATPAWRSSARAAADAAPAEPAARTAVALPTSLHLAAFA